MCDTEQQWARNGERGTKETGDQRMDKGLDLRSNSIESSAITSVACKIPDLSRSRDLVTGKQKKKQNQLKLPAITCLPASCPSLSQRRLGVCRNQAEISHPDSMIACISTEST